MDAGAHHGVVRFEPLSAGREAVLLGCVTVGEIAPTADTRRGHTMCFRLGLPDSAASAWVPAIDIAAARRGVLSHLNDWLNAADVRPNGGR